MGYGAFYVICPRASSQSVGLRHWALSVCSFVCLFAIINVGQLLEHVIVPFRRVLLLLTSLLTVIAATLMN